MSDVSRRAMLGLLGVGTVGAVGASWPRLTGADIPGRGSEFTQCRHPRQRPGRRQPGQAGSGFQRPIPTSRSGSGHPGRGLGRLLRQDPHHGRRRHVRRMSCWSPRRARSCSPSAWPNRSMSTCSGTRRAAGLLRRRAPVADRSVHVPGQPVPAADDFNSGNMYLNTGAFEQAGLERPRTTGRRMTSTMSLDGHEEDRRQAVCPVLLDQPALRRRRAVALRQRHQLPEGNQAAPAATGSGIRSTPTTPPAACAPAATSGWNPTPRTPRWPRASSSCAPWSPKAWAPVPPRAAATSWSPSSPPGSIGTTPAGGFWVEGLNEAGMGEDDFDVSSSPSGGPSGTSSARRATPS